MIEYKELEEKYIDGITEAAKQCFNMPWSKSSFKEELERPYAVNIVALDNGKVIGFGGLWQIINQADITNIAVLKEYRKQGIATKILEILIEIAQKNGMTGISLEVRQNNQAAKNLYIKMGFKLEGVRKEYYEDTKEDALVMWKYFIDENLIEKN